MPTITEIIIVIVLILLGSLLIILKAAETLFAGKPRLAAWIAEYGSTGFYTGIIMIILAIALVARPAVMHSDRWHEDEKEQMIGKLMESSEILRHMDTDTARMVAECFIDKYTHQYTPSQMKEQNKLTEEQISEITDPIMNDCLRKYGFLQNQHADSLSLQQFQP